MTMIGYACILDTDALDPTAFVAALTSESTRRAADTLLRNLCDSTVNEIAYRLARGTATEESATEELIAKILRGVRDEVDDGCSGAESFAGASFSVNIPTVASVGNATTAFTTLQSSLSQKVKVALKAHGMAVCNALPGPNILEKARKAKSISEQWFAAMRAELAASVANSELCGDVQRLSSGTLSTMVDLDRQLTRLAWPSWTAIRNTQAFLTFFSSISAPEISPWDTLDACFGIAPTNWIEGALATRPKDICTLPGLLKLVGVDQEHLLQCERALMLQAVRYHSNRDARSASLADGGSCCEDVVSGGAATASSESKVADSSAHSTVRSSALNLPLTARAAQVVLMDFNDWLRPIFAAAMENIYELV